MNPDPVRQRPTDNRHFLSLVWATQRRTIEDKERIKGFNAELARQWAIETGIIEGVYTLNRGIKPTATPNS
jgi:hypothetical protein